MQIEFKGVKHSISNDRISKFKEQIVEEGDCWRRSTTKTNNYGTFQANRILLVGAHQFSYLIYNGDICKNMLVMHTCDNPWCCNPEHLVLGTNQNNIDDKQIKGRCYIPKSKATREQAVEILKMKKSGRKISFIIKCFKKLTKGTIEGVYYRYTWKCLDKELNMIKTVKSF